MNKCWLRGVEISADTIYTLTKSIFNQGFTKAHLPLVVPEHQRSVSLQLNGLNFYQGFTKAHMPLVVLEHHRSVSSRPFVAGLKWSFKMRCTHPCLLCAAMKM